MKVLIIGSKGFIGSHCVKYFASKYEVWSCDIVVDYDESNYILLDPVNENFEKVFTLQDFDLCINCSGAASVSDSYKNPQRDFTLNTYNVFKQLEGIRKYNKNCKYINLSSAAVYGNPISLPVKESQACNPISPYGLHKKMAEEICIEFNKIFGLPTCSLRIFSAYGPRLKKQLFWDLYRKSRNTDKVELFGTGKESRDFIYISDLVKAIEIVALNASFNGEAINIANGIEIKIEEVVRVFYQNFPDSINYEFIGENRKGDPINWVADIQTLEKFGYKQEITLKAGLQNYYQWIKEKE